MIPVVIVGAGPTGVTAATLLAQYGVPCLVLDRWADVYPQPRAVHLDDEIYRILSRLGIGAEFKAISRPALGLRLLDQDFRVLTQFRRHPTESIHGYPQANMFDQPELETLLRANLKRHARAELRGNAEVSAIAQHEPGRVRVTFIDLSSGEQHSQKHFVETTYVLGCDGANSVVRTAIGATMADLKFQQRWLVVDVATTADLLQWDGVHQVCNPDRAATYMRIGAARYRWEFQLLDTESADDYRTLEDLRPLLAPWLGDIPNADLELVRVTAYTFRAQLADRWRDRNVFLLGDAAHLTPPFIGQGMGAGIRDAMNLAWKLAGVLNGDLPETVLATYEGERKPHTRLMIGLALGMGWAMTAGGRLGNAIRRMVAPRLHLIPWLRSMITNSATPALRRSALVIKSRRPRQLAGTLCPNPVVGEEGRLDIVLGNGFGLVTTEPLDATQREQLRQRGTVAIIAAPGSELARWLRRGGATAAIIRPDRTVMRAIPTGYSRRAATERVMPLAMSTHTAVVTKTHARNAK